MEQGHGRGQEVPGRPGPVYQELPKPFPGLAGESRSGDANGQWFRVLAAGGTNLVTLRARRVRHDRAADPRRQPAEADQAPAAGRERAVRDAADARPAHRPPARRRSSARSTRLEPAVQGPLGEGRASTAIDLTEAAAQARGPRGQAQGLRQGHHARADRASSRKARQVTAIRKNLRQLRRHHRARPDRRRRLASTSSASSGCASRSSSRSRYQLKAEFSTAQAVVAGQGQTVRVSGVRIGDIGGVELKNGHAVVKMDIDPEYKDLVHTNATALLRPKTGLKDMFIDLAAGRRRRAGGQARASRSRSRATQPDVNPDEILSRARHRHARLPAAAGQRRSAAG